MATQFDIRNDTVPQMKFNNPTIGGGASHAQYDTAILASGGGYTQAILNGMTKIDKMLVVADRGLTVVGYLP